MKDNRLQKLMRLRPKAKILNDFYVFDTETGKKKRGKHGTGIYWELNARPESFQFGVIYGYNFSKVIYSVEEFKQEFKDPRYKGKKMFAHNAAYDLDVIYGGIFDLDAEAVFNGKFITCTNGNCIFADSLNIFQTSVEKLGKMIGIEKPELGEKGKMFSKNIGADEINRCTVDCQIVWEALFQIFEDSGDIKITQASLSMTYFRRFHQPYDIEHNGFVKHFWDSYFGGRCEAFKIGKTHAQVIDANSMYPYAMRECVFPNPKYIRYDLNVHPKNLHMYLKNYEGCVYCRVVHKDHQFGFLPVKHAGKLLFPTGEFSGCWNFNELRFALDHKVIEIKTITKVVYSDRMESPFIGYINSLFKQRLQAQREGKDFEEYRIKIFMNSLYGKFAQRILSEEIYIKDVEKQAHIIEDYQRSKAFIKLSMFNMDRKDAILTIRATKFAHISYSIPSFASYTTSFARVHLLRKLLDMANYSPVYVDTDSIFFENEHRPIVNEAGLGGWKKEQKLITEIRGLKNYRFVDKGKSLRKLKGVPSNAVMTISENDFEYFNLLKTKEALRRNKVSGVLTKRTKHISNKYDKREILSDGSTKPLKLSL